MILVLKLSLFYIVKETIEQNNLLFYEKYFFVIKYCLIKTLHLPVTQSSACLGLSAIKLYTLFAVIMLKQSGL